jgi:hypothetical protein
MIRLAHPDSVHNGLSNGVDLLRWKYQSELSRSRQTVFLVLALLETGVESMEFLQEEGPLLARNRPLPSRQPLEIDSLRQAKRVIYFDAEVANGRLDLRVTEQQLDCPQVASLPIELCDLGSS